MVSTRGGARTGADDQPETELKLRKKPVRKATSTTKTSKVASAAKATRSRKPELEPEQDDEEKDELQGDDNLTAPRVARRGRAKKDDVSSSSKSVTASRARATTTAATSKATSARITKANKVEMGVPALSPPAQPTVPRATRATASTRATAAKEKAAPLSPKKITQVPRAQTRYAKTVGNKAVSRRGDGKAVANSKAVTRRRGVSDENACIPVFRPSTAEHESDEDVEPKQISRSKSAINKTTAKSVLEPNTIAIDDDTLMSTLPTESAVSPQLQPTELAEGNEVGKLDVDADVSADIEVSADELCGPKTPMKRSSPRERNHYESTQKLSHTDEIPMRTPARRLLVLGSQGGSPQTQRPYCKPSLPMFETRPTTVARARDRAMVFPKLQPLTLTYEAEEAEQAEGATRTAGDETIPPLEDCDQLASEMGNPDLSASVLPVEGGCSGTRVPPFSTAKSGQHKGLTINADSPSVLDREVREYDILEIPFQLKSPSINDIEPEVEEGREAAMKIDPDETILVGDGDVDDSLCSQVDISLHSEQSVLIRHDLSLEPVESFAGECSLRDANLTAATPRPETIMWENLREDVTIPFNFDSELTSARKSALRKELDEPLALCCLDDTGSQSETGVDAACELRTFADGMQAAVQMDMTLAVPQHQRSSSGDARLSLDATVNLSDFLDISSLSDHPGQQELSQEIMNVVERRPQAGLDDDDLDVEGLAKGTQLQQTVTLVEMLPRPAHESVPTLPSGPQDEPEGMPRPVTPRFAMPTIASRRKSLPALLYHTPMKHGARPNTSDGASMPRIANPFLVRNGGQEEAQQDMTPFGRRFSLAQGGLTSRPHTPSARDPARVKSRQTPRTNGKTSARSTPRTSQTSRGGSRLSSRQTPKERFPGLPARATYVGLASMPSALAPMQFMPSAIQSSMKERFPVLPACGTYVELANSPTVKTPRQSMPSTIVLGTTERVPASPAAQNYQTFAEPLASNHSSIKVPATPQTSRPSTPLADPLDEPVRQEERYPGLPHRRTYEEHAKTAMPPTRFLTPSHSPAERPATVQRPASLRKIALRASTPRGSHTPKKTPLRAPALTPGQAPLTPHPGAPLKGVNAYVDVFLNDGSSANSTYIVVLHRLGASTTKTFNDRVTHVIFKEGSPATLQRLRLHNKQVAGGAKGKPIFCVNGRWVNDSNSEGMRMDEGDEAYAVDIDDQRATKRRRKSMEPTSLLTIDGNVVRDTNRKSILARSSLGRARKTGSPTFDSPSMMMSVDVGAKENSDDISFGDESPATPAYLSAPDSLVQQTAPMNRVRKLDFDARGPAKNRRQTFWEGGEF